MTMLWHVYLRKGVVFIPTVAVTEAGFFLDIEPVSVIESADRHEIVAAIKRVLDNGNPVIATPTRELFPKPVILNYCSAKSWKTFEKDAVFWKILKTDAAFLLRTQRKDPGGGWEDDQTVIFGADNATQALAETVADLVGLQR